VPRTRAAIIRDGWELTRTLVRLTKPTSVSADTNVWPVAASTALCSHRASLSPTSSSLLFTRTLLPSRAAAAYFPRSARLREYVQKSTLSNDDDVLRRAPRTYRMYGQYQIIFSSKVRKLGRSESFLRVRCIHLNKWGIKEVTFFYPKNVDADDKPQLCCAIGALVCASLLNRTVISKVPLNPTLLRLEVCLHAPEPRERST